MLDTQAETVKSKQRCNVEGCTNDRHHTLLHKDNASRSADSEKVLCAATNNTYSDRDSSGHFFMTLPVKIRHNGKELLTYALLDSGSQRTFCTRRIADELNANGSQQTISKYAVIRSSAYSHRYRGYNAICERC